jgi:PAS domain S-box-containing protein
MLQNIGFLLPKRTYSTLSSGVAIPVVAAAVNAMEEHRVMPPGREPAMDHESSAQRLRAWWKMVEAHLSDVTASPRALEGFTGEMVDELARAWEELHAYEEEVTAQREAFAASEQRYRELFDLAPEAYLVTGIFGGIQEANRAAGTLLKMSVARFLGKPLLIFIAAADRPAFVTRLVQLQEGQPVEGWDMRVAPRQGPPVAVACTVAPARTPQGTMIGLRWVLHDITARMRLEEALRQANEALDARVQERTVALQSANEALVMLLREVHHRVKNNFQVLSSLLSLQADAIEDARARTALQDMQDRVHSMAMIHEGLSQPQGAAQMSFAPYLHILATQLLEAHSLNNGRITLTMDLEDVALPLSQLIPCGLLANELLTNAMKYAFPAGQPGTIHIALKTAAAAHVALTVQDTGVGLPAGLDVHQAASLGLQLVAMLTEQLGGTLTLAQQPGTTMTVTFPLEGSQPI